MSYAGHRRESKATWKRIQATPGEGWGVNNRAHRMGQFAPIFLNRYGFMATGVWRGNCFSGVWSWKAVRTRSPGDALVCLVAYRRCSGSGYLHGSSQPTDSELACVSFLWLRARGFGVVARLARSRAEPFRSGTWVADLRISVLDGRNGRGRRKTLRGDWSVDWPIPDPRTTSSSAA